MIERIHHRLEKKHKEILELSNKMEDPNQKLFTQGIVAGIQHAMLYLPISFNEAENVNDL